MRKLLFKNSTLLTIIPIAFVILWATGFVGARFAMPYADPFAFLSVRFAATLIILGVFIIIVKEKLPTGKAFNFTLITGIFIHTIYLGAVFWAIKNGLPAGFAGVIVGLQPMITAILAVLLIKDKISFKQIIGLFIGFIGICLVFFPKIISGFALIYILNAIIILFGVIAFSFGAVLQKKYANHETLIGGIWVQYLGAFLLSLPIALLFEDFNFKWSGELIFAFIWLTLVLSIGAILLLMIMIKAGEATKVAAYFYLVPAVTAITAYFLFNETLNLIQIIGIIIASIAVALVTIFSKTKV